MRTTNIATVAATKAVERGLSNQMNMTTIAGGKRTQEDGFHVSMRSASAGALLPVLGLLGRRQRHAPARDSARRERDVGMRGRAVAASGAGPPPASRACDGAPVGRHRQRQQLHAVPHLPSLRPLQPALVRCVYSVEDGNQLQEKEHGGAGAGDLEVDSARVVGDE